MARYDRIARLDPPDRDRSFPAWFVLRDLEDRERDPEVARRARLRFLALRPVRRLLDQGFDGPDPRSLDQQIDAALLALDALPAQDPERARLASYLEEIRRRSPADLARATLDLGEAAELAEDVFAAEELYHSGLELAEAGELTEARIQAHEALGRLYRARQERDRAARQLELAATARSEVEGREDLVASG